MEIYSNDISVTNRKEFCIGERLTFVCKKPPDATTFVWTVSNLLNSRDGSIVIDSQERKGTFTVAAYSTPMHSISTLKFVVDYGVERKSNGYVVVNCVARGYTSEIDTASIYIGTNTDIIMHLKLK